MLRVDAYTLRASVSELTESLEAKKRELDAAMQRYSTVTVRREYCAKPFAQNRPAAYSHACAHRQKRMGLRSS